MRGHVEGNMPGRFSGSNSPFLKSNIAVKNFDAGKAAKTTAKRILLVEDYPANLLVATTYLENIGYEYVVATNGREAVEKHGEGEFVVILMDIQMPEMDGYEATRIIRDRESKGLAAFTPIIAMTSHVRLEDRQKCMEAGMDEYISKPFREEELKKAIEKFWPEKDLQ